MVSTFSITSNGFSSGSLGGSISDLLTLLGKVSGIGTNTIAVTHPNWEVNGNTVAHNDMRVEGASVLNTVDISGALTTHGKTVVIRSPPSGNALHSLGPTRLDGYTFVGTFEVANNCTVNGTTNVAALTCSSLNGVAQARTQLLTDLDLSGGTVETRLASLEATASIQTSVTVNLVNDTTSIPYTAEISHNGYSLTIVFPNMNITTSSTNGAIYIRIPTNLVSNAHFGGVLIANGAVARYAVVQEDIDILIYPNLTDSTPFPTSTAVSIPNFAISYITSVAAA